jgi:hypothetical protein
MNKMILALIRRRGAAAVLLGVYFASIVLLHRKVARWSTRLEGAMTSPVYNRVWGAISLAALAVLLILIAIRLAKGPDRTCRISFLAAVLAGLGISHVFFLSANLEYIHLLQYILVVPPLFALTGRFGETVFWAALLGAVDELYQYYVVWWPFQNAYDFNDVLLDAAGGLFMAFLLFLWLKPDTLRQAGGSRRPGWKRSPVLAASGGLILLALAANAAGVLDFYPPQAPDGSLLKAHAPILLSMVPREKSFWSALERKKRNHIVSAAEFTVLLAGLTGLAALLDRRARRFVEPGAPSGPGKRGDG